MRIPFSKTSPKAEDRALLAKLGFEVTEKDGNYFYITSESPKLSCKVERPAFDRNVFEVSYGDIKVISINNKTASYDSYAYAHIDEKAVERALEQTPADWAPAKPATLTDYQKKLDSRLGNLAFCSSIDGAQRGYATGIGRDLQLLLELRKENPTEHDELLVLKPEYKKLYDKFPGWRDVNCLQAQLVRQDVGAFTVMASSCPQQ